MKAAQWILSLLPTQWHSPPTTSSSSTQITSIPLDISHLYNNIAAGPGASFDPFTQGRFPSEYLPTGAFHYDGIQFDLPTDWEGGEDNVIADSQVLDVRGTGFAREFHILYAGDWNDGESGARFRFGFEDGSEDAIEVSAKNWWTLHWLNEGAIKAPYHITSSGYNHNLTQIYHWSTSVRSSSPLVSITLPEFSWPNRVHIFTASLSPCAVGDTGRAEPTVVLRRAALTTKWRKIDNQKAYAIEITLANSLPSTLSSDSNYWVKSTLLVSYESPDWRTVRPGAIHRIMPADEVRVKVWVVPPGPGAWTQTQTQAQAQAQAQGQSGAAGGIVSVVDSDGRVILRAPRAGGSDGDEHLAHAPDPYTAKRDTPEWWDDAKFGIFIHWGIYSVPAWAPVGYYAAWYQWWLHNDGKSETWRYHLFFLKSLLGEYWRYHRDTYGEDFVYDDFIPDFTARKFNASQWVELFADAGARYFVFVTKHHDGYALFDTGNSTHRSSYHLGPKRDFLRELFNAARAEQPSLHRGTYYSMPEWFNPDAGPYGFGNWPGHLARNPYDESKVEPYTGRLEGKDYLEDIQLAHMRSLAMDYESEIMWCDIGGPNLTVKFAKEWYPFAEAQGRQVVMNNRCGALPQFDTPEYARFSSIQRVKWETSEGIDPYTYGYNRRTKAEDYRSVQTIVSTLVDIVSKNGNYLLNVGPTAEGEIIKPMIDRLLEVGKWLAYSGECIYGTDYSFLGAESGDVRFTTTAESFCMISLVRPENGLLVIERAVPVLPGDEISLLGGGEEGKRLEWWIKDGKLVVRVAEEVLDRVEWAWAFKVSFLVR